MQNGNDKRLIHSYNCVEVIEKTKNPKARETTDEKIVKLH